MKSSAKEIIDVVDEQDNVIAQEPRDKVHAEGLRHRHAHVWIYNDKQEVVFQRRSKYAKSWPDRLDSTAGGHPKAGVSYIEAALAELEEETGIRAKADELILLGKFKLDMSEPALNLFNNVFSVEYAYLYNDNITEFEPQEEEEQDIGFEPWPIDSVLHAQENEDLRQRLIPVLLHEPFTSVFKKLKSLTEPHV